MKVIFCSDMSSESSSGRQRLWALQQCGVDVLHVDSGSYQPLFGRWSSKAAKVLVDYRWSRNSGALERDLVALARRTQPDLMWLEWPREYRRSALEALRRTGALLVSFQDDNPWGDRAADRWMWRRYFATADLFDVHLTKRASDDVQLHQLGAPRTRRWLHGIYSPLFHPDASAGAPLYPATFVGTCMDHREQLIARLLEAGIDLHVFGGLWEKRTDLPARFPRNFHGEVQGEEYARVLRRSAVCLGLVSSSNHDEWTMRTFEIVGCAAALLAQRTPAHLEWFTESREAEFFQSPDECVAKLRRLTGDLPGCAEMGRMALAKARQSGWLLEDRMALLLRELELICKRNS